MAGWSLAIAVLCLACGEFYGEFGRMEFRSSLQVGLDPWLPENPVARGAEFCITAVRDTREPRSPNGQRDSGVPPLDVTSEVDDPGILAPTTDGGRTLCAMARAPGVARVEWNGSTNDRVTVHVEPVHHAGMDDPLRHMVTEGSPWHDDGGMAAAGAAWAEPGQVVRLSRWCACFAMPRAACSVSRTGAWR